MLLSPCPARTVSPMAVWIAIRCGFRRRYVLIGTKFLVRRPLATTAGSLPSVSTSNQSWVMAAFTGRRNRLTRQLNYEIPFLLLSGLAEVAAT